MNNDLTDMDDLINEMKTKKRKSSGNLPAPPDLSEVKEVLGKLLEGVTDLKEVPKTLLKGVTEASEDFRDADKGFRSTRIGKGIRIRGRKG